MLVYLTITVIIQRVTLLISRLNRLDTYHDAHLALIHPYSANAFDIGVTRSTLSRVCLINHTVTIIVLKVTYFILRRAHLSITDRTSIGVTDHDAFALAEPEPC